MDDLKFLGLEYVESIELGKIVVELQRHYLDLKNELMREVLLKYEIDCVQINGYNGQKENR